MMIGSHVDGDQRVQQLSLAYAEKLWNEKGLQCMVLASFGLQAFLLFTAALRKRFRFHPLPWLSYQMADFVAVFVLAHLTLQTNDPRHQLLLLWAPVLLLHLGGQDNATAYSMEDNELWKRHLLGLVTQVVLAVYVVAKSWRDKHLLAPVVLLFVSGTIKYAERMRALQTATPEKIKDKHMDDLYKAQKKLEDSKGNLVPSEIDKYSQEIVVWNKWWLQEEYADLVKAASDSLPSCISVLTDIPAPLVLPSVVNMAKEISQRDKGGSRQAGRGGGKDWFSSRAYKMGEIQLSLIYDRLYTKVGIRYNQSMILSIGLQLLTLGATSTALLLFATARKGSVYSRVDILVTYILLVGAVTLDLLSILMVTISSYCFLREKFGVNKFTRAIFYLFRLGRPYGWPLWSNSWDQYNLIAGCIMDKKVGIMDKILEGTCRQPRQPISDETKELICNELDDEVRCQQFIHVRGQGILSLSGHPERPELYNSIDKVDFPRSVLTWHLVTDICFFLTGGGGRGDAGRAFQPHMRLSREVSNYLMDLLMRQRVMTSSEGYVAHRKVKRVVKLMVAHHGEKVNAREVYALQSHAGKVMSEDNVDAIRKMLEAGLSRVDTHSDEGYAWSLANILLRDPEASQQGGAPWKLIASVWMEMLFYLAPRCPAGFHAEKLTSGGEFITHVRFLLHNRGLGWNYVPART